MSVSTEFVSFPAFAFHRVWERCCCLGFVCVQDRTCSHESEQNCWGGGGRAAAEGENVLTGDDVTRSSVIFRNRLITPKLKATYTQPKGRADG